MELVLLDNKNPESFPDPNQADESGLVAVSIGLGTRRLLAAYQQGIFPWMKLDQPPHLWCWYSPNPRMLLYPDEFKISRSLGRAINNEVFEIKLDHNFPGVIHACATINRGSEQNSWIEPDMELDYTKLHHMGVAHSIEAYIDDVLVGGLYGLALGKAFFGESMFHKVPEASKVCMAKLVEIAQSSGIQFIDCQVPNPFLDSLGAREVERSQFLTLLKNACQEKESVVNWVELAKNYP